MANDARPLRVVEESPAYWRIVFDYPPFNIVDATLYQALQDLLVRMDASSSLRVVVFESANPEFFLAHFDLTGKIGNIMSAVGPSGLPILTDTFVRLTRSPVASIAKIRGCVRGVSSEFVLACDMRFASRENTLLGHPEVGVGLHPGGGGTERLAPMVGRGRALEIVLGANDFDGDTAAQYGYVNRALPDDRAGRLCRCTCAKDRHLRCARDRGSKASYQPGIAAVRRQSSQRPQLVSNRANLARGAAKSRSFA